MRSDEPGVPARWQIVGALLSLVLIWGTTYAVIAVSLQGFPPMKGVALRFALAAAVLAVMARLRRVRFDASRREVLVWLSQAALTFAIPYSIVFWAEQWVPSGLVAVLFTTLPLIIIPVGALILPGEKVHRLAFAGILIGFAGVALIFSEDLAALGSPRVRSAALLTLISPLSVAFGQVIAKRWGKGLPALSMTTVPMALTAAAVGILALAVEGDQPIQPGAAPVAALIYLSLVGSVVTFSLFFWVLQHVTALQLSLITYPIPVVAVAIGTLWLDEPLTLKIAAGTTLVILGVVFAARR